MKWFAILFATVMTVGCASVRDNVRNTSILQDDVGVEVNSEYGKVSVSTKGVLAETDDWQLHAGFCLKLDQPDENDSGLSAFFKSLIGC